MLNRRRVLLGASGTLLLSLAPWQIARGAEMIAVRMWPAEEYTRVTLECDRQLQFKYFFLRNAKPLRLVVDINGLTLTPQLRKQIEAVKPDDPYIASIRIGQFNPETLRLVMDLKTEVKPEVFQLKPFANYKYRLVFDIYPAKPVDDISKILNGQEEGSDDPLGALLAGLDKKDEGKEAAAPQKKETPSAEPSEPKETASASSTRRRGRSGGSSGSRQLLVVIDPGHGGEDPGASGKRGTHEKNIVLQIAKRLNRLISADPNMRAIMTRTTDHFVSLGGRVAIAQKARAHLLVSIHADAWINSSARGSSVFALSERGATSAAAKWLAKRQNESDLIGGVNISSVNKQVASVIVDMTSSWKIDYSLALGKAVLEEMQDINKLHKNRVEQAGFAVLKGQGIPSILVETAFISNPYEEKLLLNGSHQQKIAEAIYRGIRRQVAANPSLLKA
ncbi:MAG: N-acetylmuramoyl-L-alanine amidase [Burkholderia sp.]|jgi:N-acetylmuramoyl-L-alanine amidase